MKVTVLGSAAAEGIPGLFCGCELCLRARELGGKELRRRTAYLLGDSTLIDLGPDTFCAVQALGLDTAPLRHVFVTHSHEDHWYPIELRLRRPGFSAVPPGSWLTIHGNERVGQALAEAVPEWVGEDGNWHQMGFDLVHPGDTRTLEDGISVSCLRANHAPEQEALNYLFTVNGRRCLIANDTGWWPEETWKALADVQLNLVFMDCTYGGRVQDDWFASRHHDVETVVATRDELTKLGVLAEGALFVANHFSHNGGMLHADLERSLGAEGILVGFDGMTLEF